MFKPEIVFTLDVLFPDASGLRVTPPRGTRAIKNGFQIEYEKDEYEQLDFNGIVAYLVSEVQTISPAMQVEDVELDKANKRGAVIFKHNGKS